MNAFEYAGVRWHYHIWHAGGGPGFAPVTFAVIDDAELLDPDEWYAETTAYPFTVAAALEWAESAAGETLNEMAIEDFEERHRG